MDLLERFQQFAKEQNLFPSSAPTLLAVSGGIDSMVLMHLFVAAGNPFAVAHCNFLLRGAESDGDAEFVENAAKVLDIPFFVKSFETKTYATEQGISIQMAARDLRYVWFSELSKSHNYARLATAHNLNDSVETVLFNFVRGTGISGLTGIKAKSTDALIRPLLFASRDDVKAYAKANKIKWREDSSNIMDDYGRNFLRHHVVPKMQKLNPNFLNTATRNMLRLQETKDNLEYLTQEFLGIKKQIASGAFSIDKQKLAQVPAARRMLRELLKPQGFSEEDARQLAENLDHVGFQIQSASGWYALCDRSMLIISPSLEANEVSADPQPDVLTIQQDDLMLRLPDGASLIFIPAVAATTFPDASAEVIVHAANIQYPLTLRHWKAGDAFQPFGMDGQSQKLQDLFTNLKLSRFEKEQVWILVNGDDAIIWVVGLRLDERFRVPAGVDQGLKISLA